MVRSRDHDDAQDHRVVTAFGIGDRHAAIGDHTNALPAGDLDPRLSTLSGRPAGDDLIRGCSAT